MGTSTETQTQVDSHQSMSRRRNRRQMKPKPTLTKPEVATKPEPNEAEPTPLGRDGWMERNSTRAGLGDGRIGTEPKPSRNRTKPTQTTSDIESET